MTNTAATITIDRYTVTYAAWEEGADERGRISESHIAHTVDPADADEDTTLVDLIVHELSYAVEPSSYPDWHPGTWYSEEPYEHPYTGELEEVTVHLSGLSEQDAREVYRRITAR